MAENALINRGGAKYCSLECKYKGAVGKKLKRTKLLSEETKQKMSVSRKKYIAKNPMPKGEVHPSWKGGSEMYRERRLEYNKNIASKRSACPDCGKPIYKHGGRCKECAAIARTTGRTMVKFNCTYCGNVREIIKSDYNENSENHYCNKKCEGLHRRETMPRGKDHWNYKGTTPIYQAIRTLRQYKEWRTKVFERDNYVCRMCDKNSIELMVHHIRTIREIIQFYGIENSMDAENCNELWNVNNGITVCKDCHKKIHKQERLTKKYKEII